LHQDRQIDNICQPLAVRLQFRNNPIPSGDFLNAIHKSMAPCSNLFAASHRASFL
jgi:hypothetical protein